MWGGGTVSAGWGGGRGAHGCVSESICGLGGRGRVLASGWRRAVRLEASEGLAFVCFVAADGNKGACVKYRIGGFSAPLMLC